MKTLITCCLLGLTLSSFGLLVPKETTTVIWYSKQYKDNSKIDSIINMANEFTCTRKGVSWPLFGGDLPVTEITWNLNDKMEGTILYKISGDGMDGTIHFDFRKKEAKVNLNSEVGLIDYILALDTYTTN